MKIKQDPVTGLWARADGAILLPPSGIKFKKFRFTFGSKRPDGYRAIQYKGKNYSVHQLLCRAFHGLPPEDKPFVDHISRNRDDNRIFNLRFASAKDNNDNTAAVDKSIEKYGVRRCENKKAYDKAYGIANRDAIHSRAQRYREANPEVQKATGARYRARQKAKGLTYRKGSDGRFGWYPFKRA